jgi:hypothetical protein
MSKGKWTPLLAVVVLLAAAAAAHAAGPAKVLPFKRVDCDELIGETQRGSPDPDRLLVVWWIPCEFWQVAWTQDPDLSEQETKDLVEVVKPYTLVAVVDGRLGPLGGATYRSKESLRDTLSIRGTDGQRHEALAESKLPDDLTNLLGALAPIMSNLIGKLGENMSFFVFPARDAQGNRTDDPTSKGRFTVGLGSEEYAWRLPLASLLEKKTCPKCGERLNGAYEFCPWDGAKLPAP